MKSRNCLTEKTPDGSILENALTVGGPLALQTGIGCGTSLANGSENATMRDAATPVGNRQRMQPSGGQCANNAKMTNRQGGKKGNEKQHENDSEPFGAL